MNRRQILSLAAALLLVPTVAADELDLGPEELVQAGGADLWVPGYSVPSFVHWNDDHLPDLLVGQGSFLDTVKARVYLNEGTLEAPSFSSFFYVQSNGSDQPTPIALLGPPLW